jgi:hypothetical protein
MLCVWVDRHQDWGMSGPLPLRTREAGVTKLLLVALCLLLQSEGALAGFAREEHAVGGALYADGRMGVPAHESDCNIKVKGHRDAINCYDYHLTTGGRYETRFTLSCTLLSDADHIKYRKLRHHEDLLLDLGHKIWLLLPVKSYSKPHILIHTSNDFVLRRKIIIRGDYDDLTINRYTGKLYHNYVINGIETTLNGKCRSKSVHNDS